MSQSKPTISAVVIARNEESRIEQCLEALSWVTEIVLVDNGSSDKTVRLAGGRGAKIVEARGADFSQLRNLGKENASGDWILYVDADEVITVALRDEILEKIGSQVPSSYYIQRRNYYFGHPWPNRDKMQRLFLKKNLERWEGEVHESARVRGSVGILAHLLEHRTHRTLEEMLTKTNEWSEIEANLRLRAHHPPVVWWRLLRVMFTGFRDSYVGGGGWKAATVGIIESMYQGYSMFVTYAKLWEKQQK